MAQPKKVSRVPAKIAEQRQCEAFNGFTVDILRELSSPLSRKVNNLIANGDYHGIANLQMPNPADYTEHTLFARDYLAYGLLRKSVNLPISVDRKAACIQKWMQAEATCKVVNLNHGRFPMEDDGPLERRLEALLWNARRKIHQLLGDFSWDDAHASFGFSGGASTRLPRRNGHPSYKFSGKPEVTRNCSLLAICAIWHSEVWRAEMQDRHGLDPVNWVSVVEGSRFATVSKTALTDRPICIEPDMNMYIQRGIGALIRSKLKKVRIDLNDQTRNQELAKIGSRTGSLVTIDLASASDSVSLELVRWLMPSDWFAALAACRSEVVIFEDGTKHTLEKISSMGNGYTFELESLIFWALASSVVETLGVADKRIGVYGDDIVVHHEAADRLIKLLQYAGFSTNADKTFVSGPFRESCGKHYFYGADVTPFYVKEQRGSVDDLNWLANSYFDWAGYQTPTWKKIVSELRRRKSLCYVPRSYGLRAGIISTLDVACPSWDRSKQQWRFSYWRPVRRKFRPNGYAAYLAALSVKWQEQEMVVETGDVVWKRCSASTSRWQ